MPARGLDRRGFIAGVGAALTSTTVVGTTLLADRAAAAPAGPAVPPFDPRHIDPGPRVVDPITGAVDWPAVRSQFRLASGKIPFSLFLLASNPTPIRDRMARVAEQFDADPMLAYEGDGDSAAAVSKYIGGDGGQTTLCWNTTTGLGLVWGSLKIRADQEIVLSGYDHMFHKSAVDNCCKRSGARRREVNFFAEPGKATADEITGKLKAAITPQTRAVGTTWGMSSCGVRMPLKAMAAVIAEANRGRAEADRCLFVVDGVHALGAVDEAPCEAGIDVFIAGLHKWLFGPRGTGVVWYKSSALQHFWVQHPTLGNGSHYPGGFHNFDCRWALPTTIAWHNNIGRENVAARITELSARLKDGLAGIRGMQLRTPRDPNMSAGITCFEISGVSNEAIVNGLRQRGMLASHATYAVPYARIGTACINTPEEVDKAIAAVRQIAGGR
jgi:isopenicillin-N epimerase